MTASTLPQCSIIGMQVHAGDYASTTEHILDWASRRESRYVCVANVHMTMETRDSPKYREVVNGADMVTSDGMPLVWLLRRYGHRHAERVYGPDLMLWVCRAAAARHVPVALFGGTPEVLERVVDKLCLQFPDLEISAAISPPFGEELHARDLELTSRLRQSKARIIFVGLGCPKQEQWMAAHRDRIPAVLVGVGAAFNFHAGAVRQAPAFLQRMGMEWAFRLAMEPQRLWRRYLWHNPRFLRDVIFHELGRLRAGAFAENRA